MSDDTPKPEELVEIKHSPPLMKGLGWMYAPAEIKKGIACYGSKPADLEYVNMPNPREWSPLEEDWKLPDNWKEIILEGLRERIDRFRSMKIF